MLSLFARSFNRNSSIISCASKTSICYTPYALTTPPQSRYFQRNVTLLSQSRSDGNGSTTALKPPSNFAKSAIVIDKTHEQTSLTDEQIQELAELPPWDGVIPKDKLIVQFARASGPGGQNVNKVSTKADVRFHVSSADWLPSVVRTQLAEQQRAHMNRDGELCVQSSVHRTQADNVKDAVDKLREMIIQAHQVPQKRLVVVGRTKSGDERRLHEKKGRSDVKEGRKKVNKRDYD